MKNKTLLTLATIILSTGSLGADQSIMTENVRDYRKEVDSVITAFVQRNEIPDIERALRIQARENDMLALARLDPSLARSMPELLLANQVKLRDLRHLPGELIVGRARSAGIDVLKVEMGRVPIEYEKGRIFKRSKRFSPGRPSDQYPGQNDWIAHHSFACHSLNVGDYELAGEHFSKAAFIHESRSGTKRKVWEFENLISSSWAYLLNGSPRKAKEMLAAAELLDVQARPSQRARYLKSVFTGQAHPSLGMELKDSLVLR